MGRLFLVENSRYVTIRNETGIDVCFSSIDEFLKYCPFEEFGVSLTGVTYLDYEPPRSIYLDEAKGIRIQGDTVHLVPEYERLIDSVVEIKDRFVDMFWGKNLEEIRQIKLGQIRDQETTELLQEYSLTELLSSLPDLTQRRSKYAARKQKVEAEQDKDILKNL